MDYRTERYENEVAVSDYVDACVDVQEFLPYCRKCPNYGRTWSCPEYDFDPYDYWKKYQTFKIIGVKIFLPEEYAGKDCSDEERKKILNEILWKEKRKLSEELYGMEAQHLGSISLSAGNCQVCPEGQCTRAEGKPCRNPEKMRYSVESLGGNVGLTVTKYLHQRLEWIEEGKMPYYFILVCGLLLCGE